MFICVKIINFLLVGKRLANYHFKAVKTSTHPTQRLTSVFIKIFSKMFSLKFLPQKYISKTLPSENTFQIMSYKLSKRKCIFVILRQNIVPSKNIFKTASWNNTFLKLLPQKIHFQNYSIKKNIPKNLFKKLFPQKIHFQISSSKTFLKKLLCIRLFQNCFLKKYIFKIAFLKKINPISLIYSLSESSDSPEEESLKL